MAKKDTIDIHKAQYRVELAKRRVADRHPVNSGVACGFLDRLRLENRSYGRIANYAECCLRILKIKDDSPIASWTKEDIEQIHMKIGDSEYENTTKKDTILTLKRLYHYAAHGEIADKRRGKEYDPVVSWITPGVFDAKYEKIQARDLLTDGEVLLLIEAVKKISGRYTKRNIAIVYTMLEGAYRPGELLGIRVGGLEFEQDSVRVHTTGKTGPKSLLLVTSRAPLLDWLSEHPSGGDPDAYLFYHHNGNGAVTYKAFSDMIRKAKQVAGIKKRVWPYLFRHTALTEYSKRFGPVAKIYGNWARGSNMLEHYEHLANSDQEDAVLRMHNLKKTDDSKSILFAKACPECRTPNSSDASHCKKCGAGLSEELAKVKEARRASKKSAVQKLEARMSKRIGALEEAALENQRLLQDLLEGLGKGGP